MNIKKLFQTWIFSFPLSLKHKLLFLLVFIFAYSLQPSALSLVYAASKGADPVAHWRFNESGGPTAYDESANNNDGALNAGAGGTNTAVGQMWTRQGKIGGALELDGTDDYVSVGDSASLKPTSAVTLEAWIKPVNPLSNYQMIIDKQTGTGSPAYTLRLDSTTGKILFRTSGTSATDLLGNTVLSANTWYYVVGVYDGATSKIYINGVLDKSQANTGSITYDTTPLSIGRRVDGYYFNGLIDDVKIYNYARTADQILVDYNAGSAAHLGAGTDPNEGNPPVGYWTLDENTGTTAYDRSGNNNNGTFSGAPTWSHGKYGLALNFDGSDDYVNVGQPSSLNFDNTNNYTISFWMKAATDNPVGSFWNPLSWSHSGTEGIVFQGSGASLGFLVGDGVSTTGPAYSIDLRDNTWHHLVAIRSSTAGAVLYLDGKKDNSNASLTGNTQLLASWNVYIGRDNNTPRNFKGLIDDVKIYNYVRTQAQIAYDYNRGTPVAQYKFDEGGGAIAHNEYSLPSIAPHRYWRFIQTAVLTSHAPRTCELRWTDILGNTRTPDSYTHGGTFSNNEELWNTSFDSQTNTSDTGWITGNTGYITADFGASGYAMMKFEAYGSYTSSARGATWDIQYSDDNSNWTTIKTWNFQTTDNGGGLGAGNYAGWYGATWHTHGTLVGDTKFVDGKIGKALEFDGTGDYVDCGNGAIFKPAANELTVEAWVYRKGDITSGGNRWDIVGDSTWGGGGYSLGMNDDETMECYVTVNTALQGLGSSYVIPLNQWVHLAMTAKIGDKFIFYANGVNVREGNLPAGTLNNNTNPLRIAGYSGGVTPPQFVGLVDDVRIYNYARTAGQVLQDYNTGAARLGASSVTSSTPGWRDKDWHYRKPITLTNGGSQELIDFQVLVTVDTSALISAGKMQSDGRDIRFTNQVGDKYLNYWVESGINTATTKIWVKVDRINIGTNNTTIYMHCGNPNALASQSGANTFLFFDDFTGSSLSAANWPTTSGTVTVASGKATIGQNTYIAATGFDIRKYNGLAMEGYVKVNSAPTRANFGCVYTGMFGMNEMGNYGFSHLWYTNSGTYRESGGDGGGGTENGWFGFTTNWNRISLKWLSGTSVAFVSEGNSATKTDEIPSTLCPNALYPHINVKEYSAGMDVDWVFFRKYVSTEPAANAPGTEELSPGPVAHWRLDEATSGAVSTSAGAIKDESSNHNDGTASNTTWSYATGKFGGALSFDGNDSISVSNSASLNFGTGDFTVEYWMYYTGSTAVNNVFRAIGKANTESSTPGWLSGITTYGGSGTNFKLLSSITNGAWGTGNLENGSYMSTGTWYHVALVRSGTTLKHYRNGSADGQSTLSGIGANVDNNLTLDIGRLSAASPGWFVGKLDDVRIYNYARTADQIQQDYLNGAAVRLGD